MGEIPWIKYSSEEQKRLAKSLNVQLGPEFIKQRTGPGNSGVNYLEGNTAINLANEIFGPTGWRTELRDFKVDYVDFNHGTFSVGIAATVRVILKDGTFHEDIGYGSIENARTKSSAFEKCRKEAFTDGLKRALRQFGNALGNCLYDKTFLANVKKVRRITKPFDENLLMRPKDLLPKPRASVPTAIKAAPLPQHNTVLPESTKAAFADSQESLQDSFQFSDDLPEELGLADAEAEEPRPDYEAEAAAKDAAAMLEPIDAVPDSEAEEESIIEPENVTFVGARSAEMILKDPTLQSTLKYNISASSPKVGKSQFINHTRSAPVKKAAIHAEDTENRYKRSGITSSQTSKRSRR